MGSSPDRRRRVRDRFRCRYQLGRQGTDRGLFRVLCSRLPGRGACGAPRRGVHRGYPAATAPVRHGARGVLLDAQLRYPWHQGHADQLRLPLDRAVSADVLHLGGSTAAGHRPLVCGRVGRARRNRPGKKVRGRRSAFGEVGVTAGQGVSLGSRRPEATTPFGRPHTPRGDECCYRPGSARRSARQASWRPVPVPARASARH